MTADANFCRLCTQPTYLMLSPFDNVLIMIRAIEFWIPYVILAIAP